MKTLKLVGMAIVSMAVVLVSCSGSDGETGPQGVAGADGTNGIDGVDGSDGISCWDLNGNGTGDAEEDVNDDGNFDALDCQGEDGANGTDGNANVQELFFILDVFANYDELNLDLFNLVEVPENYAYLFYMEQNDGTRYHIPGNLQNNSRYARVETNLPDGTLKVLFYDLADNPSQVPGGLYTRLITITMELSNTGKTSENIMSELKAAGVDTSDYNAVAEYFGLE